MGQIKNIKLHIVTDIKQSFHRMSAFRGARVLASLGQHGIRCNRLHQRRIVSLGLTSLCQVAMKKRAMLNTSVEPVNKYDLSSVSLVSAVSDLLTNSLELLDSEEEAVEIVDAEAGFKRTWVNFSEMKQIIQNTMRET